MNQLQHRLSLLHPAQKLRVQQQKIDELSIRLHNNLDQRLATSVNKQEQLKQRLALQSPLNKINNNTNRVVELEKRLINAINKINKEKQNQFKYTIEQLNLVSPLATIARGYSVTKNKTGKVITTTEQTKVGDKISVQVSNGYISARVTDIESQ